MKAGNGSPLALDEVEARFGVATLSDADLMETEGGMIWYAAVAVTGGAALGGVLIGAALYWYLH